MNVTEFVNAIRMAVENTAVNGQLKSYRAPPGRKPSEDLVELSNWYKSLTKADQEMLGKAMRDAVGASIFGFLCVLDGVRVIENSLERGELELWYVKDGNRTLINDPSENLLHDEYNAV